LKWLAFGFKGEILLRYIIFISLFILSPSALAFDEPKETTRPITDADSVVAIYREDWGLLSSGSPAIILAAWPDGHIIWSGDHVKGGVPYFRRSN
jgi:hypothetical protein